MNNHITFNVEKNEKADVLVADWRDSSGPGRITTQGSDIFDLQVRVKDAVLDFFEPGEAPESILLYVTHKAVHVPVKVGQRLH